MAWKSPAAAGCIGVGSTIYRAFRPAIEKGTGAWTRDPSSGFLAGLCPLSRKYSPARTHPPSGGRRLAGGSPDTSGRRSAVYGTCGLPFGKGFPQGQVAAMPRGPVAGVEDCLPLRIWRLRPLVPYAKELPQGDRRGATPAATLLTPSLARRSGKRTVLPGTDPAVHDRYSNFNSLDRSARSPRSVGDPSPKNRPVMERSRDPGRQSRSGAAPSATGIPPSLPEGRYCRA